MYAQVNGYRLFYEDTGQGVPVVLLHGFPLSSRIWSPIRQAIARHARLITPDLRGHGLSEKPDGRYSMASLAHDMATLVDRLGLEKLVLGGHSMGGYITFQLAQHFPERLRGLILVDTRAEADTDEGRARRLKAIAQIRTEGAAAFLEAFLPGLIGPSSKASNPQLLDELKAMAALVPDHVLVGCLQGMLERPDSRPLLPALHLPVLVLVGEEDQLTPPSEAQAMAEALPLADLVVIPQAGHTPSLEAPQAVAQAILHFIRRTLP